LKMRASEGVCRGAPSSGKMGVTVPRLHAGTGVLVGAAATATVGGAFVGGALVGGIRVGARVGGIGVTVGSGVIVAGSGVVVIGT
jgi:hypothetical protein